MPPAIEGWPRPWPRASDGDDDAHAEGCRDARAIRLAAESVNWFGELCVYAKNSLAARGTGRSGPEIRAKNSLAARGTGRSGPEIRPYVAQGVASVACR